MFLVFSFSNINSIQTDSKYHQILEIKTYHKNNLFIYFMRKEKSTLISLQTLLIIFNIHTNKFSFC